MARNYKKFADKKPETEKDYKNFSGVDPRREDMPEDSKLWDRLISLAWQVEVKKPESEMPLTTNLMAMRIKGTLIGDNGAGGYKLRPKVRGQGNWASEAAYRATAEKLLKPYNGLLLKLLKEMARELPPEVDLWEKTKRMFGGIDATEAVGEAHGFGGDEGREEGEQKSPV